MIQTGLSSPSETASGVVKGETTMTVWHNVPIDMPKYGEEVLAIKETKSGVRSFCFATLFPADKYGPEHWVTGGGCTNVIYWTPLPKMPEKSGDDK